MATARQWIAGTRPRTLPAAVVPVMIGSGVAAGYGGFSPGRGALGLIVALALQVGVNYSNDYSDGIRDTDAIGRRVGPMRLVGSGLAAPRHVMLAAFIEMRHLSWLGLLVSVPAGPLSCGLFMVNNLRDVKSDPLSGKRTLAVRTGDRRSRTVYALFVLAAALAVARPYTLLTLLALPFAWPPLRAVRGGATGPALITVLGQTSRLQIAFGLAFALHG